MSESASGDDLVGADAIRAAAERISRYVVRTPTVALDRLSDDLGLPVVGKLEMLQHTGAFKARGAFNAMLSLSPDQRAAGVVAASGGNHGLAVAYAARTLGIRATVVMPGSASLRSVAQARADGAEVIVVATIADAFAETEALVAAGRALIHPFDDPAVICGQGTLALELHTDAPDITDVVASIGGGGMISGVAVALKAVNPAIRIWGVETVGADAMAQALRAGRPVALPAITSIATTLGAPSVSERTLALVASLVEDVLVCTDAEAVAGIDYFGRTVKVVAEPATGCLWPAVQRIRRHLPDGARVALVLCGGNASYDDIATWRARYPA